MSSQPKQNLSHQDDKKELFDAYNSINMYASLLLEIFGLFSNSISVMVLLYCKKKSARINSINSLIFFTLTNILFLVFHFYNSTLSRIIYYFNLDKTFFMKIHLYESNSAVCKIITYTKLLIRFSNLSIIINFSFKRIFAIYFPIKSFRKDLIHKNALLYFLLSFSVLFPSYILFLYEIVPVNESVRRVTRVFTLKTMAPILNEKFCSVSDLNEKPYLIFRSISNIFILIGFLFVSFSILLIVLKLKIQSSSISYHRYHPRVSTVHIDSDLSSRKKSKLSISCSHNNSSNKDEKRMSLFVNQRFHNAKMLSSVSASFILFNFPYFLVMLIALLKINSFNQINDHEMLLRLFLKRYLIVVEIFQLVNISISGLLLFISGKTFRKHFIIWLKADSQIKCC